MYAGERYRATSQCLPRYPQNRPDKVPPSLRAVDLDRPAAHDTAIGLIPIDPGRAAVFSRLCSHKGLIGQCYTDPENVTSLDPWLAPLWSVHLSGIEHDERVGGDICPTGQENSTVRKQCCFVRSPR